LLDWVENYWTNQKVLVARKAIQSQFTRDEMVEGVCDDLVRMRQLLYTAPSSNQILTDSDRIQNKRNRIKRSIKKIRAGTVKQGSMSVMFDWVLVKLWRSPARRRTRKSERRLQGSKTVIGVCIVNIAHILLHSTPIKIELILFD
jgi:hypothetical protein